MPTTKNTIYQRFLDFKNNHTQIKDFGYGDVTDISMQEATTYPLMWVSPQPCPVVGKETQFTYVILVADRVQKDRGFNALEVESDTFQICQDILAWADDQSNNDWELSESTTITPFIEKFKDEVEGNMFTIVLKVPFNYDECAIPKYSPVFPPAPTNCPGAIITINGDSFTIAQSGDTDNIIVKNTDGDEVGEKIGDEWIVPVGGSCADGSVQLNGDDVATVASGGNVDINVKDTDGNSVGSLAAGEWIVPIDKSIILKGFFSATIALMGQITIDVDNAGTYTSLSQDGSSGTITFNKNGAGYVAFSNPLVLAIGDTLNVQRTITTGDGYFKLTGTY